MMKPRLTFLILFVVTLILIIYHCDAYSRHFSSSKSSSSKLMTNHQGPVGPGQGSKHVHPSETPQCKFVDFFIIIMIII